jgi:hypothetical protein
MNWLVWFLFESLGALGAVLGVALFVLLVHWRRTGRSRPLLIGLAIAAVLLVTQALVVTQRERAARILAPIERDVVASRTTALEAALAPDFTAGDLDREQFLAFARRQFQRLRVRWLDRWALQVDESQAARFVASATYVADIAGDAYAGSVQSRWAITFVRTPAGWRIANLRPLHVAGLDEPRWSDLDRR